MNDEDFSDLLRFFGDGGIKVEVDMRDEVREIKAEIEAIKRRGCFMSGRDARLLRELEADLEGIQSRCQHWWEIVTLFSHVRQFCARCDKENKDYRHVR